MRRISAVFLTVASVAALSACGAGPNMDGDLTITDQVNGQNVRVDLPKGGEPAEALAIWFHGQNGDVNSRMNEDWLNALRDAGWAVAAGDLAGNAWGNSEATAAARDLQAWAEESSGATTRLLVAGSMGGITSLNALDAGAVDASCWYGIMPVVDPGAVEKVSNSREQIAAAWGDESPGIPTGLPAIRYRVLASPDDELVPKPDNADIIADIVPEGTEVAEVTVSGPHGDPSHFDPADLASFASTCL